MPPQYFSLLLARHGGAKIINSLQLKNIDFIVVGSTALAFYDLRPVQEVADLGLMVKPPEENLEVLLDALRSLRFGSVVVENENALRDPFMRHIPIKMHPYCCDLLTASSEAAYRDLSSDAVPYSENGLSVQIASQRSLQILIEQAIIAGDTNVKRTNDLDTLKRGIAK